MAMAATRKKGDYSVLSEINTEEEWNTLCTRKGLTVVDVYSEWSGPCSAMTNFLKKIKLEVNDDLLQYAMAKSDTIPQLHVFKGQCKPTWLFLSGGEPVAVMHGANAPLLQRMIEKEMRRERQVLKGEAAREVISLEDAVPAKSRSKAASNLWADTDEEDNADSLASDEEAVDENEQKQQNFTILLVESYIYEDEEKLLALKTIFNQEEFEILQERDLVLTLDDIRNLTSGLKVNEDQMDVIVTKLLESTCRVYMLRCDELVKAGQKMNEIIGPLYEDPPPPPGEAQGDDEVIEAKGASDNNKDVEEAKKKTDDQLTVDRDRLASSVSEASHTSELSDIDIAVGLRNYFGCRDAEDNLPGFLCPDYAGFLGITEKHFYDALTSVLHCGQDFRKIMAVFPEDMKDFTNAEINDLELQVLGTCSSSLNEQKAQLLMNKRRNKNHTEDEAHGLLVELSNTDVYAVILKRDVDKEARAKQNEKIKELAPVIVTLHLGSMRIFFTNIEVEEKTVDGEIIGELDQGDSSDGEDPGD